MPPVGFEPAISGGERPQTYALDRAATGNGVLYLYFYKIISLKKTYFFFNWHASHSLDCPV